MYWDGPAGTHGTTVSDEGDMMSERTEAAIDAHRNDFPINGFHHIEMWVGNAYHSAHYYRAIHGYKIVGYSGPETGVPDTASYALQQGDVRMI